MRALSYLVYIVFWETLVLGGTGYAVFVLGASGWWFLLALLASSAAYSPKRWAELYPHVDHGPATPGYAFSPRKNNEPRQGRLDCMDDVNR